MPEGWTDGDLVVHGAKLHYYRMGTRGAPPLVLQHGFSDNGLCWLTLAGDLKDEYDIILPDARGHGRSARLEPGECFDQTDDLAGLILALGIERPVVAGHSMGGTIAAQLGGKYPNLPRALILEDPAWFLPPPRAAPRSTSGQDSPHAQWIKSLSGLSLEQLIERHRAEHPTWSELVLHRWSEGKRQLDYGVFKVGGRGRMDWQEVAPAIACPTLLITATPEKGGIVTPEVAQMAREMNELITVAHIPGTGHHVRFENYSAYRDAIVAFLGQVQEQA